MYLRSSCGLERPMSEVMKWSMVGGGPAYSAPPNNKAKHASGQATILVSSDDEISCVLYTNYTQSMSIELKRLPAAEMEHWYSASVVNTA